MNAVDQTPMSQKISANHKKVVEFIPYKTMHMDLESILANVTRVYVNRHDVAMVELLSLSEAELFPIGSFDAEAEKYEYVLQLAVPVKFYNHLKANIVNFEPQLLKDITAITAPYKHEYISEVFIVIKIERDSGWREAALDWAAQHEASNALPPKEFDFFICHAPGDEAVVKDLKDCLAGKEIKVVSKSLVATKEKELHHVLKEFEKTAKFGLFVISPSVTGASFAPESLDPLVHAIMDPSKRFFQVWHNVGRADVANFSAPLARSLAFSTERMSVPEICGLLLQISNLG